MIRDVRDALFAIGGATVFIALAGLALDNPVILNIGLKSAGVTLIAYSAVALGVAGANIVSVVQTVVKAVSNGRR